MLDTAAGKLNAHPAFVLIDALEAVAEVVMRGRDGFAQQALQPVPGREDLPQRPLAGHAAVAVDRHALGNFDAEIARAGAAGLQRVEQFRVRRDAGAAADQFDRRTLVDVGLPADLAQERRGEQARHRAANDDGTALATGFRGRRRHVRENFRPSVPALKSWYRRFNPVPTIFSSSDRECAKSVPLLENMLFGDARDSLTKLFTALS